MGQGDTKGIYLYQVTVPPFWVGVNDNKTKRKISKKSLIPSRPKIAKIVDLTSDAIIDLTSDTSDTEEYRTNLTFLRYLNLPYPLFFGLKVVLIFHLFYSSV